MEQNDHPYKDPYDSAADYDQFSLRFIVDTDIDSLGAGESWEGDAYLWWLNLWNTDEIMEYGNEDFHNIACAYWIPLEYVEVKRSGDNVWTVTVGQRGESFVVFWETYYQEIWKEKGKSGKMSLDSEYRRALGSATPFKFITKWTRN